MLALFPFMAIVVVAYNVAVFAGMNPSEPLVTFYMLSGAEFSFALNEFLLTLGLVLLFVEILKATRTGTVSVLDHMLSMLVAVVALVEFVTLPAFATSTFFLITLMCFVDVVAGFTVTIAAARRDIGTDGGLRL